jgi:hypothetical protein
VSGTLRQHLDGYVGMTAARAASRAFRNGRYLRAVERDGVEDLLRSGEPRTDARRVLVRVAGGRITWAGR